MFNRNIKKYIFVFIFFYTPFIFGKKELTCEQLNPIQYQYLEKHVSQPALSFQLKKRVVDQLIKNLDDGKLYFIELDIKQIKNWFTPFFNHLEKANCNALYKLYNLFYQRVKERVDFAEDEISKPTFKLDPKVSFVLNSDKRPYADNKNELNNFHRKYLHYELASIMMTEEDETKAKEHLLGMYKRLKKKVYSWDPRPSKVRLLFCSQQEEKNKRIKTCKYEKWYALYLDSFAKSLDPHSSYFSRYELEDFEINMRLSLEGVGASLSSRYGYTVIEKLLPGGSAFRSRKLKKKDKIIAIGQTSNKMINIFGWDLRDVVEMVRGKKGTKVHLKVLRSLKDGKQKKIFVTLVRDKIPLQDGASSIIYSKRKINGKEQLIGVLRIPSFYGGSVTQSKSHRSVSKDIKKLIKEAKEKGVSGLVLDLSGNGGGVLTEAIDVVGLFLEKGNVVRQMTTGFGGHSAYQTMSDTDNHIEYDGSLVVLVDRSSASASEIVAGALQDYKRAVIVGGDHTFGKGSIQSVENLPQGLGAVKVTVGLFFIPGGKSIQKMGVNSDISLPSLISVDAYGEKKLDYVLPRQNTSSFLTRNVVWQWKKIEDNLIKKLKLRSLSRVKKSDKFKKINNEITEYEDKLKNQSLIKIETVMADAKKRNEENKDQEELSFLDTNDPKFHEKYLQRADIEEAVNIAWDLALLTQKKSSIVQKKADY